MPSSKQNHREYFNMQLAVLIEDIRVNVTDVESDKLYKRLENLSSKRIAEVFEYIKQHHDIPNFFPMPAEFHKAIEATRRETRKTTKEDYIPMKRENDNSNVNEEWKRLQEGFKIMDIIREMVCKPIVGIKWNDSPHITCDIMHKFYREEVDKGMVFDVGNKQWIPASHKQSVGGYYWHPEEWGNW